MLLDRFKKIKKEPDSFPAPLGAEPAINSDLPSDLERFRIRQPEPSFQPRQEVISQPSGDYPTASYGRPMDSILTESAKIDKADLILQKLETIDARLRFLEEKMKRF